MPEQRRTSTHGRSHPARQTGIHATDVRSPRSCRWLDGDVIELHRPIGDILNLPDRLRSRTPEDPSDRLVRDHRCAIGHRAASPGSRRGVTLLDGHDYRRSRFRRRGQDPCSTQGNHAEVTHRSSVNENSEIGGWWHRNQEWECCACPHVPGLKNEAVPDHRNLLSSRQKGDDCGIHPFGRRHDEGDRHPSRLRLARRDINSRIGPHRREGSLQHRLGGAFPTDHIRRNRWRRIRNLTRFQTRPSNPMHPIR